MYIYIERARKREGKETHSLLGSINDVRSKSFRTVVRKKLTSYVFVDVYWIKTSRFVDNLKTNWTSLSLFDRDRARSIWTLKSKNKENWKNSNWSFSDARETAGKSYGDQRLRRLWRIPVGLVHAREYDVRSEPR